MRHEVITITSINRNPSIEAFRNAVEDMRFIFKASRLCEAGMTSSEELIRAVEQAMKVCIISGIPVRNHFKAFYIADEGQHDMTRDWKLSKLGFALVMLNGDAENPMVGKLQLELIRKYISY
ncbi:MAG: damage-inducible protein D [Cyclobacteriaceae bacterium]